MSTSTKSREALQSTESWKSHAPTNKPREEEKKKKEEEVQEGEEKKSMEGEEIDFFGLDNGLFTKFSGLSKQMKINNHHKLNSVIHFKKEF